MESEELKIEVRKQELRRQAQRLIQKSLRYITVSVFVLAVGMVGYYGPGDVESFVNVLFLFVIGAFIIGILAVVLQEYLVNTWFKAEFE